MRTDLSPALTRTALLKQANITHTAESARSEKSFKQEYDAAIVHCGNGCKKMEEPAVYKRPKMTVQEPVFQPAVETVIEPAPIEEPIFAPGKSHSGSYADGKFQTDSGLEGEYYFLNGGRIGIEVGGFHGILTGNDAVVFNPETGESYSMKIYYGEGQFKISEVQEYKAEPYKPNGEKPFMVEGENKHVQFKYGDNGKISVTIQNPETKEIGEGHGILNPDGTFVIRFGTQNAITGHWTLSDAGKLMLFDRKPFFVPGNVDKRDPSDDATHQTRVSRRPA